jgi:hypothetical protein
LLKVKDKTPNFVLNLTEALHNLNRSGDAGFKSNGK